MTTIADITLCFLDRWACPVMKPFVYMLMDERCSRKSEIILTPCDFLPPSLSLLLPLSLFPFIPLPLSPPLSLSLCYLSSVDYFFSPNVYVRRNKAAPNSQRLLFVIISSLLFLQIVSLLHTTVIVIPLSHGISDIVFWEFKQVLAKGEAHFCVLIFSWINPKGSCFSSTKWEEIAAWMVLKIWLNSIWNEMIFAK